ncbi:LysR substrate-binding domain-containing protein [Sinorhizobium mexicanum]|uniref:LysR family transcriptional regulator n=1 Tax=Sinorhizobium mexicanum TaxID=375549 RepID=A0A859QMM9_9HYPH|nr:LysR substrate-binding domain-containing protein [Sinorhizobium mexicanum]MBP1881758.1 LysR family glycine cleavage system transcriptional activator [Sinorhizobium mexicanum]QLL61516.1 LysR family transcriptional regulator [Sinorhizobium mexicanum]
MLQGPHKLRSGLPPLHALRAFESVGRTGSAKDAALELCITQSAISHQLRQLEDALGIKLFERRGRSLSLTLAGREYFVAVAQALALVRDRTETLIENEQQDTVTVASLPSFAIHWLIPRLSEFFSKHSRVNVNLRYTLMGESAPNDAADLRIRYGSGTWEGYMSQQILGGSLIVVCTPEYLKRHGQVRETTDLRRHQLIHDQNLSCWRQWFASQGLTDFPLSHELVLHDQHMAIAATLHGQGIGLCRSTLIADDLAKGRLVRLFEHSTDGENGYHVCWREEIRLSSAAKAFRRWLVAQSKACSSEVSYSSGD